MKNDTNFFCMKKFTLFLVSLSKNTLFHIGLHVGTGSIPNGLIKEKPPWNLSNYHPSSSTVAYRGIFEGWGCSRSLKPPLPLLGYATAPPPAPQRNRQCQSASDSATAAAPFRKYRISSFYNIWFPNLAFETWPKPRFGLKAKFFVKYTTVPYK